jgi:hypothetical protein
MSTIGVCYLDFYNCNLFNKNTSNSNNGDSIIFILLLFYTFCQLIYIYYETKNIFKEYNLEQIIIEK